LLIKNENVNVELIDILINIFFKNSKDLYQFIKNFIDIIKQFLSTEKFENYCNDVTDIIVIIGNIIQKK
jgi:hypothetical protein